MCVCVCVWQYGDDYLSQGGYLDSSVGYNTTWGSYGGAAADRGGFIGGYDGLGTGMQDDFYPSRSQGYTTMGDQGGYIADPKAAAGEAPAAPQ